MHGNRGAARKPDPPTDAESPAAPSPEGCDAARPSRSRRKDGHGADAALSRELSDFLVEFSIVLHKRSMYPAGHPQLEASADRFVRRLDVLLERRESVTLGVARDQLVIENVTTSPRNALLRELARRLHRHRIASVRFSVGTSLEEIDSLLGALAADPQRGDGPLGPRLPGAAAWPHIELHPAAYGKLALRDDEGEPADATTERELWIELAQAALAGEGERGDPDDASLIVEEPRERERDDVTYDKVVLGYLTQIAEESSGRVGAGEDRLRQRVARLIKSLDPDTLRRLLEAGADHPDRKRVALDSSQLLALDAVVEVLEGAAESSESTISHNMLRLLHKLAQNTKRAAPTPTTDAGLRKNVARLLGNWALEDPNPSSYTAILEGMVRQAPTDRLTEATISCEPDLVLRMALEVDCVGPSVTSALDRLLERRAFETIATILDSAPSTAASGALWKHVATPERLRTELLSERPDRTMAGILVGRLGADATDPLLDTLERSPHRSVRAAALRWLRSLGPRAAEAAAARLENAPWFLQRNILQLFAESASWPDGFSPVEYAAHPDPRVRREAYKILFASRRHRDEAVSDALKDRDDGIVAMALSAALDDCPCAAIPQVEALAAEGRNAEHRVLAIRVLTQTGNGDAVTRLTAIAFPPRRWLPLRLGPKSPELLAALTGLARLGPADPRIRRLLFRAAGHRDPEIRAALAELR
ncbi:MAG TPA: hypothetical protein VFU00_04700 [Gemmatimonadales bacterium]|nr:hypothetical protein [Gemmatimonadales bacterium]